MPKIRPCAVDMSAPVAFAAVELIAIGEGSLEPRPEVVDLTGRGVPSDQPCRCPTASLDSLATGRATRSGNCRVMRSVNKTRDLRYLPHIHYLVPAGAFARAEGHWVRAKGRFLVHVKPLGKLFRGKIRAGLRQLK